MIARIISILTGLWLMAAPSLLNYGDSAANNGHIVGPVIITFAVIAIWEATYGVRKWNYPLAVWLLLAPWILGYDIMGAYISDIVSAIIILICTPFKGKVHNQFGGGWSSLWKKNPEHMKMNSNQL